MTPPSKASARVAAVLRLLQIGLASLVVSAAFRSAKKGLVYDFGTRVFEAGPYWVAAIGTALLLFFYQDKVEALLQRVPRVVLDAAFLVAGFLSFKHFT